MFIAATEPNGQLYVSADSRLERLDPRPVFATVWKHESVLYAWLQCHEQLWLLLAVDLLSACYQRLQSIITVTSSASLYHSSLSTSRQRLSMFLNIDLVLGSAVILSPFCWCWILWTLPFRIPYSDQKWYEASHGWFMQYRTVSMNIDRDFPLSLNHRPKIVKQIAIINI